MSIFTTGHQTMEDDALEEALKVSLTSDGGAKTFPMDEFVRSPRSHRG